jgi:hypothetical protein
MLHTKNTASGMPTSKKSTKYLPLIFGNLILDRNAMDIMNSITGYASANEKLSKKHTE